MNPLQTLVAAAAIFASSASAFDLADYKRITLQAVDEMNRCFPGTFGEGAKLILWNSDLDEDLDLLRKEIEYSHFYNPTKPLEMRRYDSSVRVSRFEADLISQSASNNAMSPASINELGHAIHHLQDMASPPHVVPVMHGLGDGFEKYRYSGDISSGWNCQELRSQRPVDLRQVQQETAMTTLNWSVSTPVEITAEEPVSRREIQTTPEAFWAASLGNTFGGYGFLGNHFGESSFTQDGTRYSVSDSFFASYKQRQMKLGVQATLRALLWKSVQ